MANCFGAMTALSKLFCGTLVAAKLVSGARMHSVERRPDQLTALHD
jgi:hypothetical protein